MTGEQDNEFQQYQALDLKIAKALQIDVPELKMPELPEIDSSDVTPLPQRKRSMKPVWFAIAATVVLATSISVRMSGVFESYDSLPEAVLAHIDHEPYALQVSDVAVSDERLARAIPASIAAYERGESLITYAQPCVINGKSVPHLVIQGEHDYRIPYTQGMAAFNIAQMLGIPSRMLFFPSETHFVLSPQNGIMWQREFQTWLDQWLKE